MLTLKLTNALESLGKSGKVILIDGTPELLQRLVVEQFPPELDNHEVIQALVLQNSFKFALPNDTSDRLKKVLAEKGWQEKLKKIDELYNDFSLYSKEYTMKSFTALFNRITLLTKLDLKSFPQITTTVTLVKPTEISLHNINNDYGLSMYVQNEIDIRVVEGNHMSILENKELPILINHAF